MLKIYDNFFDSSFLSYIENLILESKKEYNWNVNHFAFPERIRLNPGTVLSNVLAKTDQDTIVNKLLEKKFFNTPPSLFEAYFQIGLPNSSIDWHTDNFVQGKAVDRIGLTIYLNKNWQDFWGGFFMYEENNKIFAIRPNYNRAVCQTSLKHCTTIISPIAEPRLTLQLFFDSSCLI